MMVYGGEDGRPMALGPELAHGGQGIIQAIAAEENSLAKIYFQPDPADRDRLLWMVNNPPPRLEISAHHATVAWPQTLLYDAPHAGRFIGYVMPRVRDSVLILNLMTPKLRASQMPEFDLKYLHRTARNLAIAVGVVHHSDYVVGDLNESNVLVTAGALVTLIDVDSFQTIEIRAGQRILHPCPVGKPEYTAPELQGAELSHVLRTNEHDAFALAVLVFQLLMAGRHPFQSLWKGANDAPSIADKINRGLFPYAGPHRSMIAPPPHSTVDVLHPALRALIVRCFVEGQSDPLQRPGPDEWETALAEAEASLIHCRFGHCYAGHLSECPECDLERLALKQPRKIAETVARPARPALAGTASRPAVVPRAMRPRVAAINVVAAALILVVILAAAITDSVLKLTAAAPASLPSSVAAPSAPAATVLATGPASAATHPSDPGASQIPLLSTTGLSTLSPASLHTGPGPSFPVLRVLERGTLVVPIGRSLDGIWLYVAVVQTSERGWIEFGNIALTNDIRNLPVQEFWTPTP